MFIISLIFGFFMSFGVWPFTNNVIILLTLKKKKKINQKLPTLSFFIRKCYKQPSPEFSFSSEASFNTIKSFELWKKWVALWVAVSRSCRSRESNLLMYTFLLYAPCVRNIYLEIYKKDRDSIPRDNQRVIFIVVIKVIGLSSNRMSF